jgi:hypothetical protein
MINITAQKYGLNKLFSSSYNSRTFLIISLTVLVALIIDLCISSAIDTLKEQVSSSGGMLLFTVISIISISGQYAILTITKTKINVGGIKDSQIILLHKITTIVMIVLGALLILVILEIYITLQYYTPILSAVVLGAYGFTSVIMGILTYRLGNWFKSSRTLVVLIYGLAAGAFTINALASAILFEQVLVEKPLIFTSDSTVEFNFECSTNPFKCFMITFQTYTLYAYFVLMWCGTVILLHHNTKRVGKTKFWLLVALPLIAFYFAYVSAYNELYQIGSVINPKQTDLVKMFLIIALATLCGILYGIGFRSVGMLVSSKEVREYMIITGYGIVLYFIAANSTVAAAGFPPFGLVSISFVPTAAFLILLGLYHSAISVAHDAKLRREVKTSTINETRLLGSIGTAQMQFLILNTEALKIRAIQG